METEKSYKLSIWLYNIVFILLIGASISIYVDFKRQSDLSMAIIQGTFGQVEAAPVAAPAPVDTMGLTKEKYERLITMIQREKLSQDEITQRYDALLKE